ncbi:MAG: ABC transporter ATP-binding protein [Flavobacteriaceae bacterium]
MSPVLELRGLRKAFGGLVVTDGVDLSVDGAGIHALIGPNGAGKTTLIGEIAGTVAPDAGTVLLDGVDVTAEPAFRRARRGLARSFQITAILPSFTAAENVALAIRGREGWAMRLLPDRAGDRERLAEAAEMLETVGLGPSAERPAGTLSHGEKRALELAMAIARRPRLLLLDEPMAGTGPEETRALVGVLRKLRGSVPILLVEHDMDAVFALADRISVLVYGRIVASGAPDEIRASPEVQSAYLGDDGDLVA